jgi:hypothetical protein
MPNLETLICIGDMIRISSADLPQTTAENIRQMNRQTCGAEILRLIVRDDLGDAADVIVAALRDNL